MTASAGSYGITGRDATLSTGSTGGSTDTSLISRFEDFSSLALGDNAEDSLLIGDAPGVIVMDPNGGGFQCVHDHILQHTTNTFQFGCTAALEHNLQKGDEVWVTTKVLLPVGSSYYAEDHLKWFRLHTKTSGGTDIGYNDMYLIPDGTFAFIYEGEQVWSDPSGVKPPVFGVWTSFEEHIVFDNVPASAGGGGLVHLWRDNELILTADNRQTLTASTDYSDAFFFWTYYNTRGGAPDGNQDWYWTDYAVAIKCASRDDSVHLITDPNGIKRIGVIA